MVLTPPVCANVPALESPTISSPVIETVPPLWEKEPALRSPTSSVPTTERLLFTSTVSELPSSPELSTIRLELVRLIAPPVQLRDWRGLPLVSSSIRGVQACRQHEVDGGAEGVEEFQSSVDVEMSAGDVEDAGATGGVDEGIRETKIPPPTGPDWFGKGVAGESVTSPPEPAKDATGTIPGRRT